MKKTLKQLKRKMDQAEASRTATYLAFDNAKAALAAALGVADNNYYSTTKAYNQELLIQNK